MAIGEGRERREGCLVGVGVFSKPAVWGAWAGGMSSLSERLFPDRQAPMLLLASHLSSTPSSHAVFHSDFPLFLFVEVFFFF